MRWSYNLERSYAAAMWLFAVAFLVFAMVVVGGATRLTESGLSITEWKPINGVIPPLSEAAWQAEFAKYQQIPQYRFLNTHMTLSGFKGIFWWEWAHRLLGRVVGLVFLAGFIPLLATKSIPRRLIWRCWVLFGLGAFQAFIGWWMVSSGLTKGVAVAAERLAVHQGLALIIYGGCVWTGLEAWFGRGRNVMGADPNWRWASVGMVALAYIQCLLGALVAGNRAGRVFQDWPLMNGQVFPSEYLMPHAGLITSLLHSQAAVQFNHRLFGYVLFGAATALAIAVTRSRGVAQPVRRTIYWLAGLVTVQVILGVATLRFGDPLWLGLLHQIFAVVVLTWALLLAWRAPRN
jgi:cytochrome c oxidase assembly protein subunit 15